VEGLTPGHISVRSVKVPVSLAKSEHGLILRLPNFGNRNWWNWSF